MIEFKKVTTTFIYIYIDDESEDIGHIYYDGAWKLSSLISQNLTAEIMIAIGTYLNKLNGINPELLEADDE